MNKKIIVKKIYSKIAELWRQYFADVVNPLFLYNDDTPLLLAIGETYVKLISNKIATEFPRNSESELDLKFKMIKVVILKKTKSDLYQQALNNVLDQQKKDEEYNQLVDDLYKLHDEYDNYKNKKEREAETPRDDENTEEISKLKDDYDKLNEQFNKLKNES